MSEPNNKSNIFQFVDNSVTSTNDKICFVNNNEKLTLIFKMKSNDINIKIVHNVTLDEWSIALTEEDIISIASKNWVTGKALQNFRKLIQIFEEYNNIGNNGPLSNDYLMIITDIIYKNYKKAGDMIIRIEFTDRNIQDHITLTVPLVPQTQVDKLEKRMTRGENVITKLEEIFGQKLGSNQTQTEKNTENIKKIGQTNLIQDETDRALDKKILANKNEILINKNEILINKNEILANKDKNEKNINANKKVTATNKKLIDTNKKTITANKKLINNNNKITTTNTIKITELENTLIPKSTHIQPIHMSNRRHTALPDQKFPRSTLNNGFIYLTGIVLAADRNLQITSAHRPKTPRQLPIYAQNNTLIRMDIATNGNITFSTQPTVNIYLDGIFYKIY